MNRPNIALLALAIVVTVPTLARAQDKPKMTHTQMLKAAKVTQADARIAALREVPGARVTRYYLRQNDGVLLYEYTLTIPHKSGSELVRIDATTGGLLEHTRKNFVQSAAASAKATVVKKP